MIIDDLLILRSTCLEVRWRLRKVKSSKSQQTFRNILPLRETHPCFSTRNRRDGQRFLGNFVVILALVAGALYFVFFCLFITLFGFGRTLNLVARNFKRRHGHAVWLTRVLHQRDGRAPHYINVVGACGGRAPMFFVAITAMAWWTVQSAECIGKYPELHRRLININFNHVLFFPHFIRCNSGCISDDSGLHFWWFRVHFWWFRPEIHNRFSYDSHNRVSW